MMTIKELNKILSGLPENYAVVLENPTTLARYPFNIEINNNGKFVNFKLATYE